MIILVAVVLGIAVLNLAAYLESIGKLNDTAAYYFFVVGFAIGAVITYWKYGLR